MPEKQPHGRWLGLVGRGNAPPYRNDVRLTAKRFTCKTHSGAPRLSGAPLAAMHEVLTLSLCKRRDAARLETSEAARPPGAAYGVLSGASSSWAANRQFMPFPL